MLSFFAIVAFLVFQLGQSLICFYMMDARRHRQLLDRRLITFF